MEIQFYLTLGKVWLVQLQGGSDPVLLQPGSRWSDAKTIRSLSLISNLNIAASHAAELKCWITARLDRVSSKSRSALFGRKIPKMYEMSYFHICAFHRQMSHRFFFCEFREWNLWKQKLYQSCHFPWYFNFGAHRFSTLSWVSGQPVLSRRSLWRKFTVTAKVSHSHQTISSISVMKVRDAPDSSGKTSLRQRQTR